MEGTSNPPVKTKKKISQVESDQILTREYTKDFDWKNSEAWRFLQRHFGSKLNHADLTRLAELCLVYLKETDPDLYFPREAARRKVPLVRWYNDNLDIIIPFVQKGIVVQRLDGQLVGCEEATEQVLKWQSEATVDEIVMANDDMATVDAEVVVADAAKEE